MNDEIQDIINKIDLRKPYIWKLKISETAYKYIEQYLISNSEMIRGHITQDSALIIIIFLAEWYKRVYCGSVKGQTTCVDDIDLKRVWEVSGINTDQYVYKTSSGTHLWKYSIYVLGGLAINHELARNDNGRFLKGLCRMFHGEDFTLENLDEENRAIAFRQSITRKDSLYEFLEDILNGNFEVLDSIYKTLIDRIKSANEEVLRSKFSIEWIVSNSLTSSVMRRSLRVWLKPEEVGGKLHQYLRYDRIHIWGVPNPEKIKKLYFSLRWKLENKTIQDIDRDKPILTFINSENGFVCWGNERYSCTKNVPIQKFSSIEVVAFDDSGNEWIAQKEDATDWMQLWRIEEYRDEWSSKRNNQHQTAVIFNSNIRCNNILDSIKPFKNPENALSENWNWCYIYNDVTLIDSKNNTFTLYNRVGYDQIFTKLYNDTILYSEGGLIKYSFEDEEEGELEDLMPLIFSKNDILVRHFKTKDAIKYAEVDYEEECSNIEFKNGSHYEEWNNNSQPQYGIVHLRINEKGVVYTMDVAYLKGPIKRNYTDNTISYFNIHGKPELLKDNIELDKSPLCPHKVLNISNFELNVIRPTLIKEVMLDNNVITYTHEHEGFILPYIFKNRVKVNDFSAEGYKTYDCKHLTSIFKTFTGIENQALTHLDQHTSWPAYSLDEQAPKWLKISLTKESVQGLESTPMVKYNIYSGEIINPFFFNEDYKKGKGEVFFQDLTHPNASLSVVVPLPGRPDKFRKGQNEFECFKVAARYNTYFSIFTPLRLAAQKGKVNETLVAQIRNEVGNDIPLDIQVSLRRYAEEFNLDFNKFDI